MGRVRAYFRVAFGIGITVLAVSLMAEGAGAATITVDDSGGAGVS